MRRLGLLFLAGACLLTEAPPSPGAEPDPDRVDRLIRQLGSDRFKEREAAAKALEELGEPALPALKRAATDSPDVEVRRRAEALLKKFPAFGVKKEWEVLRGT